MWRGRNHAEESAEPEVELGVEKAKAAYKQAADDIEVYCPAADYH